MIHIDVDTSAIDRNLQELTRRLGDLTPIMQVIAGIMRDAVEQNFEREGRPRQWIDLAPSTIRSRQRKGYWPGRKLQQTGQLAASISSKYGRDFAMVGTNKKYAAIHQFGGTIRQSARTQTMYQRVNRRTGQNRFSSRRRANFEQDVSMGARVIQIPARPFLVLAEPDERAIQEAVERLVNLNS